MDKIGTAESITTWKRGEVFQMFLSLLFYGRVEVRVKSTLSLEAVQNKEQSNE